MNKPLSEEPFVLFTTYRSNGDAVSTPVWIARLWDGRLGFTTAPDSWKVKRLRRDDTIQLQPCTRTGDPLPDSEVSDGTATVIDDEAGFSAVQRAIMAKYGLQAKLILGVGRLLGRETKRVAVIVALAD